MLGQDESPGVQFLLSLADQETAAAVRRRIGLAASADMSEARSARTLREFGAPHSVRLWLLEQDDPGTNAFVYHYMYAADQITRDIALGVPFGSATGPLPVVCGRSHCLHEAPKLPTGPDGMLEGLRKARTMDAGRRAARSVSRRDWQRVAEADRVEPLPGFARWALSVRIDCPPEVRAQFGSHPKFTHRVRRAGVIEMREYVEGSRPARGALAVLHLGMRLFPTRVREAEAVLAPLVRAELGSNLEAWAVLAQLLPTFTGTAPDLVRTSGAIASV